MKFCLRQNKLNFNIRTVLLKGFGFIINKDQKNLKKKQIFTEWVINFLATYDRVRNDRWLKSNRLKSSAGVGKQNKYKKNNYFLIWFSSYLLINLSTAQFCLKICALSMSLLYIYLSFSRLMREVFENKILSAKYFFI